MVPDNIKRNFDMLFTAAIHGDLALVETTDAESGEVRYVIVAVNRDDNGGGEIVPFGHMSLDPYNEYTQPEGE